MKTTIYLVRHGESESNASKSYLLDHTQFAREGGSPLTVLGKKQAEQIGKKLAKIHFDALFSSNLNRAVETAQIISTHINIPVTTVSSIHERLHGAKYTMLSKTKQAEVKSIIKTLNDEKKMLFRLSEDGESSVEAVNRFMVALKEIIQSYHGKTILVVNHGNIMRMLLVKLGWAKFDEVPTGAIKNTGYYVLETDGVKLEVKETHGVNKRVAVE